MPPYADPNSDVARATRIRASRKYYATHKEKELARSSKWLKAHPERVNELAVIRRSKKLPPAKVLWWNAHNRAKAKGIEFTLKFEDVVMPDFCPVLGMPLVIGTGCAKDNSPSLDRIDPTKGYVPGNVRVISHKANTIKSNASIEDIRMVLAYMEKLRA